MAKSTLKTMYHGITRSKIDYAAPAWQPLLSKTNMIRIRSSQIRSLCIATGQLVSTLTETLRREANVQSCTKISSRSNILKAKEKSFGCAADHSKRIIFEINVPHRLLTLISWRRKETELSDFLPDALEKR